MKAGRITEAELCRMLGLARLQVDGFLKAHGCTKTTRWEILLGAYPWQWMSLVVSIAKMQYSEQMAWIVELLDDRVREELVSLPLDMQARFRRIVELIQGYGLERVREPHVKHLEGPLWEMRMKGRDGVSRAIYITAKGRRVVVVRAFVKKTQKTPRREIDMALKRVKEVKSQ